MCSGERVRREAMGTSQPRAGTHSSGMFSGPILTIASEPWPRLAKNTLVTKLLGEGGWAPPDTSAIS